jgi:hypothetical protein
MKLFAITFLFLGSFVYTHALVINEVMSNPTGDDSGREWIELYNDETGPVELSSMAISIKGGTAVAASSLQGGTSLAPGAYAIIGSTVSGATKFLLDYPSYGGMLFKSSISLVNTGVTSIEVKVGGAVVASLPSYTAAKEGSSLSFLGGSYVTGMPTPGSENQIADTSSSNTTTTAPTATTTDTQVVLPQATPPSPNIIIYMPTEKVVVAGAESEFSVFSQTREGKALNDLTYTWAFGDGGQAVGSSTKYTYAYAGRYVALVQGMNATVSGSGRMAVRVVPPDISITAFATGKYGAYVDIQNPNTYDLDLSQWILTINNIPYTFPKNTILSAGLTTRFSGVAMGFAKADTTSTATVRILFPDLQEVTRYESARLEPLAIFAPVSTTTLPAIPLKKLSAVSRPKLVLGTSTTSILQVTSTKAVVPPNSSKDTRIVSWLKSFFK